MESNSGPGETMALSEIITCPPGDESGQNANQEPSDDPAGEMTVSCMDKLSQKIYKFIVNPLCILIFALLLLTELICCAIQTANLYYHRHINFSSCQESECILTILILVLSSVNFIIGLLICFSKKNEISSFMDKLSQKFKKLIMNPICILIFSLLTLTELICCAIQTYNLFTKASSSRPEIKINSRYYKYSLIGLLLPPLLIGTALVWIKFLRKKVIIKVLHL